jgi:V/A-type H+-transporting ATPase subunit I
LDEKSGEVVNYLDTNRIFYEMDDPKAEDNVPIQIKNDSYSKLFEPILRMYSLPNYHDIDPTPFFAPFFMLFFGLCMCDAGYGVLILLASLFLRKKLSGDLKGFANLGIFLGGMTIVCGGLTGSFFGIDLTKADWAFLAPMKPYFINEANFKLFGYSPMMVISVIIGFVQVLVGMALAGAKAAKNNGWKFAVGKVSWVLALFTTVFAFGLPMCGIALPSVIGYLLYGIIGLSVLGIFFFNSPDKNILMNFGIGLWDTYGMATGLLGDLLSYIRLFALGLTGGVLGGVFNTLAIDMSPDIPVVHELIMVLILLLGHSINFALCMISSFVHPMRLTFVEFFKNASFDGGGKEFSPFKIKIFKK